MENFTRACEEIVKEIKKQKINDQQKLNRLKLKVIKRFDVSSIPTNIDIASAASKKDREKYNALLTIKPTRTGSGVAVCAVMTKPFACKHGKCTYCPGGPDSVFGDMPQSYTGKEPATRRGIRNHYDPYLQVFNRLEQYLAMNKMPDKIELIIMGGTFPSFPKKYRDQFVGYSFKAMNDFSKMFFSSGFFNLSKFKEFFELPGPVGDPKRTMNIHKKLFEMKGKYNLAKEQKRNEKSKLRCVALCIETRPDYCSKKEIDDMLRIGTTRVELGVQSVYDDVLKRVKRGHSVSETVKATRLLKDALFKVGYHMMPGLPGVGRRKDLDGLFEIINNDDLKPDTLKIYPCMVMPGTRLYNDFRKRKFSPMTTKHAISLISEFKEHVPEYMRIMRVQRDIPTFVISKGVDRTNLRQYVKKEMKEKGIKCRCIRCREPGTGKADLKKMKIKLIEYRASKGNEYFISAESKDFLLGFCRLRISKFAGIRELHVYGPSAEIGRPGSVQHKGLGRKLVKKAEEIAKKNNMKKVSVISGVGVREYYRKLGYRLVGTYMVKAI